MPASEQYAFQTEAINVYKADMQFVLNQLEKLNNNPEAIFYHHLNLTRIGLMGHSAGGTAAIETSRIDPRIRATIDMDGWFDHVIGWQPLKIPLLLMFCGTQEIEIEEPTPEYLKRKQLTREQYFERERTIQKHKRELCKTGTKGKILYIPGITHGDFSDVLLAKWPVREWNDAEPYATLSTINMNIINFFDKYLK